MADWKSDRDAWFAEHMRAHEKASDDLAAAGFPVHSHPAFWETETGHHFMMDRDQHGNWELSAGHSGQPEMHLVHVHLGPGDENLGDRVTRVFRDREFMGHLGDMYNRARLNGNPTGYDFDTQRVTPHRGSPDDDIYMDRSG